MIPATLTAFALLLSAFQFTPVVMGLQLSSTAKDRVVMMKHGQQNSKNMVHKLADKIYNQTSSTAGKVPLVMHRIWGLAPQSELDDRSTNNHYICERFVSKVRNSWTQSNPNWQEWVWSKPEIDALVDKLAPQVKHVRGLENLRALYDSLEPWVKKSDVARYMIMYAYGGVYLDMDIECTVPMDNRFTEKSLYLRVIGTLPRNHILASAPGNEYWLKVLSWIADVQARPGGASTPPVRHTGEDAMLASIGNETEFARLEDDVIVNSENGKDPDTGKPKACIHWKAQSWLNSWHKANGDYQGAVPASKAEKTETCKQAFEGAISGQSLALKAGLALQTADSRMTRTWPIGTSMVAVVNDYMKKKDLDWLTPVMPVEVVGITGYPRAVSEAGPWLEWIDENYDNLPDYVAFLHGDQHSWHAYMNASEIYQVHPQNVEMLARPIYRQLSDFYHGAEKSLIDVVFPAVFGRDITPAYAEWKMDHNKCCSEMVVTKEAIRKIEHGVYKALIVALKANSGCPWGPVLERMWQVLFQRDVLPTSKVEAQLAKLTCENTTLGTTNR